MARTLLLALALPALAACEAAGPGLQFDQLTGTWGGQNVGLIMNDSTAHVHIGCTFGDAPAPIAVSDSGTFSATGQYNISAFPVGPGVFHPALFTGRITGATMVLTITLTDTAVTLGPAVLTFGAEPRMGPCPICRIPRRAMVPARDRSPVP